MVFEKEPPKVVQPISGEVVNRININTRRIKAIEQRLSRMELRIEGLEEKIIDDIDNLRKGFEQISMDVKAIGENLSEIRAEILKINKTLDKTAKKAEVKELESLLDLYSPIKSKFATREEVERIVDKKLGEKT